MKLKSIMAKAALAAAFLACTVIVQAETPANERNSWFGIRISQASWEPAVFNELDKLRQIGLQNSALFTGSLLANPADYFDYGNARQKMPFAELLFVFAGESNRGTINLGFGGSKPTGLDTSGLQYLNSQTFNIVAVSNANQFSIFQSAELKHYEFGYDHEFYPFRGSPSLLSDLGFVLGLQLARDEFFADQYNTGTIRIDSGTMGSITSSSTSQINSFGSTEHNITTGDIHLGLVYRKKIGERFELEAGASFGAGKGQSNAIFTNFSVLTLGTSSFPFETSTEYSTDGDIRTSRFHLGMAYLLSEGMAINLHYGVTNRFYTPTSGSVKAGGIVTIENPASGPFYSQKDKLSTIGLEFQARF